MLADDSEGSHAQPRRFMLLQCTAVLRLLASPAARGLPAAYSSHISPPASRGRSIQPA